MLPATAPDERWETLIDTADPWQPSRRLRAGDRYELHGALDGGVAAERRKEDFAAAPPTGVRRAVS